MRKIIVKKLNGTLVHEGILDFETQEKENAWFNQNINSNAWGKPDRWETETDGTHAETREVSNEFGAFTEYFFPAEYTYTIEDITQEYEKEQARLSIFNRRRKKRQLARNILDIINDHIDQLNLTENQENAIDNALSKLEKGRPDRLKSKIEDQNVNAVFTQELKDKLLDEFSRFGL